MGGLFRVQLVVGFVAKFRWAILAVLAILALGYLACGVWMHHDAQLERTRRERAALAAGADQQHAWVLAGDDRGIYGDYPVKQID